MSGTSRKTTAILLSLAVYPGAGQIYLGQKAKGIALAALFTVPLVVALWIVGRAFATFLGLVTTLQEPVGLAPMLWPALPWVIGTVVAYVLAAVDAARGAG